MASSDYSIRLPAEALSIIEILEAEGYEAWCVGGYVRDSLLGRPCADVDIATNAHWTEVARICEAAGMGIHETGTKHGTVTVVVPSASCLSTHANDRAESDAENLEATAAKDADGHAAGDTDDMAVEVTTFRTDGVYTDARHPRQVRFVSSLDEDLARRDFTINALAYHPARGLKDPYKGADDINNKVIRAIGEPRTRFSEDALRILRGCRFASQLGFRLEAATYQAMMSHKHLLSQVSIERIVAELDTFLLGEYVHDALMETVDVLAFVLPELAAIKDCAQVTKYHLYDVLEHTAYVTQYMPATRLGRWAALCHDMGKPAAAFFTVEGVEHFYGHERVGMQIAKALAERLLMGDSFKAKLVSLVKYHDEPIEPNLRAVRRMLAEFDGDIELFGLLCDLKRADALAHTTLCYPRAETAETLKRLAAEALEQDKAFSLAALAVDGNDVMALGIDEGPEVGRALRMLLDAVIDEKVENDRDALLELLRRRYALKP